MDYPTENKKKKEVPWWDREPNPEASKEKLLEQISQIQIARKRIPRLLLFKQASAVIYLAINLILIIFSMGSLLVVYIAVYMIPLSIVLIDYLLIIKDLKKKATGEN